MAKAKLIKVMALGAMLSMASPQPLMALSATAADKLEEAKSLMMADSGAALELAREAESLTTEQTEEAKKTRLTARWLEGEALMRLNRAPQAAEIIESALEEAERNFPDNKLYADLLRSNASLHANQGEYGTALEFFLKAHDRYKALGESRSRAIVLQNIGSLYSDARDYERVLRYYRQAHEAYAEDVALSLSAHNNKGNALKELGRYKEAEQEFRTALEYAGKMESPMLEARILTNIASTQYLDNRYDAAQDTVRRGLAINDEQAAQWHPFLYGVRAQVELARRDLRSAEFYVQRTFRGQDLGQTSPFFRDFHETAFQVYSGLEDYQQASRHLEAFHRLDGQASDLSATANNSLLAARFDAESRELRISKLSADKSANEARLANAQQQVILLSVAIALFIAAIFAILLVLRTVNRSKQAISSANAKLVYATQHDGLTRLFSREHFRELLEQENIACAEADEQAVLMLIDLDRFKQVNDIYGHAAGDTLLKMVAERFRLAAGPDAVIGRLGGDEFGVFLPHQVGKDDASVVAAEIVSRIGEPFLIEDKAISIGASVGLTVINGDGTNTSTLMTNADLALYEAKDRGRGTHVVYRQKMRQQLEERSDIENDLARALANNELSISYQPIVGGGNRDVICYEALMRWEHPVRGNITPDVFIPIAEDTLLIQQLGAWMLRTACKEAATWPDNIKLTVNVSTLQLSTNAFLATVVDALASSGLAPNRLVLELTESIVLEMNDQLEWLVNSLNDLGVKFALDDFGRGYSSLNYIEKMHFSMIKIDRDFVQAAAAGSERSKAIVSAIVSLAQSLEIDVTAEGIEAEDQAEAMSLLGCSSFQGFLFGYPEPRDGAEQAQMTGNVARLKVA
ncbi:EAL domain-containing protein [Altererythrobacter sp. MF3-039]|uniref:EAL domain-containing protein n=1 Tax=Altererythrobacter sp. MF3-039 TaxID=3252901 RepID=UPI00390CD168